MVLTEREKNLIELIRRHNVKSMVEVGVRDGELSRVLLSQTDVKLHGVDINPCPNEEKLIHDFPGRFTFMRMSSVAVAEATENNSYDMVFIDANHQYDAVCLDIRKWWDKVKINGVLAGDDYLEFLHPTEGWYGVVDAVEECADEQGIALGISTLCEPGLETTGHNRRQFARAMGRACSKYFAGTVGLGEGWHVPIWWMVRPDPTATERRNVLRRRARLLEAASQVGLAVLMSLFCYAGLEASIPWFAIACVSAVVWFFLDVWRMETLVA